jgi:hypothetical protein
MSTPRAANGSAILPVPIANSSARPPAAKLGEQVRDRVDLVTLELLGLGVVVARATASSK